MAKINPKLRAELLAQARRELSIVRGALAQARSEGAPDFEQGQCRAAIRSIEDDIDSLTPRKR